MATMNKKRNTLKSDTNTTENHAGETVHELNALETIFSKVLGSFFGESTFYEKRTAEGDFKKLCDIISEVSDEDKEYVLKIAHIGREYNMIQYPLALLTVCMNDERFKGENFLDENTGRNKLQTYTHYIVRRAKDITDILAMQMNVFGFDVTTKGRGKNKTNHRKQPLPIQMRKALKGKLETFNEYQLSKALGESREVSMADAIKLLHPDPRKAKVSEDFFKDIIEGNVKMGNDTKQVQKELANVNNKNSKTTKSDVVDSLDTSTVMAIVKNLVALYRQGIFNDEKAVNSICSKLTNKKEVQKSRLLPFRFYSAYVELSNDAKGVGFGKRKVLDALIEALDLSISNLPDIEGYNAILIDMSGSMNAPISSKSSVSAREVACVLGAICAKKGTADVYLFADKCKMIEVSSKSTVMDITKSMLNTYVGGGTYIERALNEIKFSGEKYDKLIILSDNDCYTHRGNTFKFNSFSALGTSIDDRINEYIKLGVFKKVFVNNLLGNNFAIVNTDDYRKNLITGFSERIVDVINIYGSLGSSASDIRVVIDNLYGSLRK